MSFSSDVKKEMMSHPATARHCRIAELAGYIISLGRIEMTEGAMTLVFESEHEEYIKRTGFLLSALYEIKTDIISIDNMKSVTNRILVSDKDDLAKIFEYSRIKLRQDSDGSIHI